MKAFKFVSNIIKGIGKKVLPMFHQDHPSDIPWSMAKIHKHLDDITPKKIKIDQLAFTYEHRHSLFHTYKEIFVREIYKFRTQSKAPVIIDCGANIGLSVLYFKKQYPQSSIFAFEPDPHNFTLLKNNLKLNNFLDNHVELFQEAIWTHNDGISFNAVGTEGSKIDEKQGADSVKVSTRELKTFLAKYPEIDFLKIDIEGAENIVIPDCREQLLKVKNMFLEYHGRTNELAQLNSLLKIVEDAGFSMYMTTADDSIQIPFVQQHSVNSFDVQLNIFCYREN